ncbi:MAG: TRAP transporter large permease subunit [Alkalispirochaetaceae bacterium]
MIAAPILPAVVQAAGMGVATFGVVLDFDLRIGLSTPPVGTGLFVGCTVGKTTMERNHIRHNSFLGGSPKRPGFFRALLPRVDARVVGAGTSSGRALHWGLNYHSPGVSLCESRHIYFHKAEVTLI